MCAANIAGASRTVGLHYNALGLLLYKSDVGNYAYPAQGSAAVRPHGLQSVTTVAGTRTTVFLYPDHQGGPGFEREKSATGAISNRHYLSAGGQAIGVLVTTAALQSTALVSVTAVKLEFWHQDHLGSIVATSDHAAVVTARYAYDPFGKRRYADGRHDDLE